jgi:hypothetical protein
VRKAAENPSKRLPDAATLSETRAASGAPRTVTGESSDALRPGNPNKPSGGPPNASNNPPKSNT